MAACIMRIASASSFTVPIWAPPRPMIETRWPVLPSNRVGSPVSEAPLVCAIACEASAAADASTAAFVMNCLREVSSGIELNVSPCLRSETLADVVQLPQHVHAEFVIGGRRLAFEGERSTGLQDTAFDFFDFLETLPPADHGQLRLGQQFLSQALAIDLAVFHQHCGSTFD